MIRPILAIALILIAGAGPGCHRPMPLTPPPPADVTKARAPAVMRRLRVAVEANQPALAKELVSALNRAGFRTVGPGREAHVTISVDGTARVHQASLETRWYYALEAAVMADGKEITREAVAYGAYKVGNKVTTNKASREAKEQTVAWLVAELADSPELLGFAEDVVGQAPAETEPPGQPRQPGGDDAAWKARRLVSFVSGASGERHPCAEASAVGAAVGLGGGERVLGAAASSRLVLMHLARMVRATQPRDLLVVHLAFGVRLAEEVPILTTPKALDDEGLALTALLPVLQRARGRVVLSLDLRGGEPDGQATLRGALRAALSGEAPTGGDLGKISILLGLSPAASPERSCAGVEGSRAAAFSGAKGRKVAALAGALADTVTLIGDGTVQVPRLKPADPTVSAATSATQQPEPESEPEGPPATR